jgi:ketosteroid isomerase-like protein
MPQEHVEIVRQTYARWARGDFRAGTERYDPYVVLVLWAEFPDARAYCGAAEIGKYMREDFLADWKGRRSPAREFLDAGDSVVVRVRQRAPARQPSAS